MAENKGPGRPELTLEQVAVNKQQVLQKIEPYLKSGLSVNKAIREAHIANSEFYKYMEEDELFREKIGEFRQFVAVLLNNALVRELMTIVDKQNGNEAKKIKPEKLSRGDKEFLKWFALNSNLTKQEFGERKDINLFDPEAEIQKVNGILEEKTTKDLPPLS